MFIGITLVCVLIGLGFMRLSYTQGRKAGLSRPQAIPEIGPPTAPTPNLPTRNERWMMEVEHETYPYRKHDHKNCRVCGPGVLGKYEIPSAYDHVYYKNVMYSKGPYGGTVTRPDVCAIADSEIVSSEIEDGNGHHTLMLDIDLPARVIESSTPGHHHLYIDHPMKWKQYLAVIEALTAAGIVEKGFLNASKKNKATHLRVPWVEKDDVE